MSYAPYNKVKSLFLIERLNLYSGLDQRENLHNVAKTSRFITSLTWIPCEVLLARLLGTYLPSLSLLKMLCLYPVYHFQGHLLKRTFRHLIVDQILLFTLPFSLRNFPLLFVKTFFNRRQAFDVAASLLE